MNGHPASGWDRLPAGLRRAMKAGGTGGSILVDGHVHVYPSFDPQAFLRSAEANFRAAANETGAAPETPGVLLLTESRDQHYFRHLSVAPTSVLPAGWSCLRTAENRSVLIAQEGVVRLIAIAGRQIATSEGLEVLAIGCNHDFLGDFDLYTALAAARAAGGVPVIPWGFGKWWGQRGSRVAEALETAREPLFLGDNGGRLRAGNPPPQFDAGARRGIFTLPGSDPLPFRRQQGRAGSYGFVLEGSLDLETPAASLQELLWRLAAQPRAFGTRARLLPFLRDQARMQLAKRKRGPSG